MIPIKAYTEEVRALSVFLRVACELNADLMVAKNALAIIDSADEVTDAMLEPLRASLDKAIAKLALSTMWATRKGAVATSLRLEEILP